ncbi:MAG: TonB-dependent receptor [Bacteroidota bacterium]|nr:TonB-dependent receptor [Bacteroidota bacterium]
MKKITLVFLLSFFSMSAIAQNASVQGSVVDIEKLPLPGAVITETVSGQSTVTNELGQFILTGLGQGKANIQIISTGYQDYTEELDLKSGEVKDVLVQMKMSTVKMSEVIVNGNFFRNQMKAFDQQRQNTGVTNVVNSDQIGRTPDANIGDALKRITGVTIQNDQGEARDVIIRGLAPQLNSVTVNGERMPSAEGDNRKIQLDLIPSDMIQTVVVNKAVTADMDADAIGGSVNLVTRQAPQRERISITGGSGYNFLSQKPIWTGAAIYGNRFLNNKLGAILSVSVNDHDFGSDNAEMEWEFDDQGNPSIVDYQVRGYNVRRLRQSYSLSLDYKLAQGHTLFFTALHNDRKDWENRYRLRYKDIESNGDGTFTAEVRRQTKGGGAANDYRRLEHQIANNFALRGEHLFGNVKANWSVNSARASERRPDERYISYRQKDVVMNITSDAGEYGFLKMSPANTVNFSDFGLKELTNENQWTYDQDLNSRLDVEIPLRTGKNNTTLKVGARLRTKTKYRNNDFTEYEYKNGDDEPKLDANGYQFERGDRYLMEGYWDGGSNQFIDPTYLGDLDLENADNFDATDIPEEYAAGNYEATETITAAYAMLTQNWGAKHRLVVGLRGENTNNVYNGFVYDIANETATAASGEGTYTNILPSMLYRFAPNKMTVIRTSLTNTLARPNYFDLVPYQEFNSDDNEVSLGNANLQAATAWNFDLNAERYFSSLGIIGVGVFYKSIDNFIYENVYDDVYRGDNYEVTKPQNGGTATVSGLELTFQRQLDFISSSLKNFNVAVNTTFTSSSTTGILDRTDEVGFAGTAPMMLNTSLSYEDKKLMLRLSYNYAGAYIDEYGGDKFEDRFYDKQHFIDLNGYYAVAKNIRVFAELHNLLNTPLRYFQYQNQYTMQMEYYNMRANFGVKIDL